MRTITVERESVCAADDQCNPLSLELQASDTESIESFVARILARDFLQFGGSQSITGYASGRPIVKVFPSNKTWFLIAADTPVGTCLRKNRLKFIW